MLSHLLESWVSLYANHGRCFAPASSSCTSAVSWPAADVRLPRILATISATRTSSAPRATQLLLLKRTHRIVALGLVALAISGLLLFGADVQTFLYSRIFWLKMGLLVLLLCNGVLRAARRAPGDPR